MMSKKTPGRAFPIKSLRREHQLDQEVTKKKPQKKMGGGGLEEKKSIPKKIVSAIVRKANSNGNHMALSARNQLTSPIGSDASISLTYIFNGETPNSKRTAISEDTNTGWIRNTRGPHSRNDNAAFRKLVISRKSALVEAASARNAAELAKSEAARAWSEATTAKAVAQLCANALLKETPSIEREMEIHALVEAAVLSENAATRAEQRRLNQVAELSAERDSLKEEVKTLKIFASLVREDRAAAAAAFSALKAERNQIDRQRSLALSQLSEYFHTLELKSTHTQQNEQEIEEEQQHSSRCNTSNTNAMDVELMILPPNTTDNKITKETLNMLGTKIDINPGGLKTPREVLCDLDEELTMDSTRQSPDNALHLQSNSRAFDQNEILSRSDSSDRLLVAWHDARDDDASNSVSTMDYDDDDDDIHTNNKQLTKTSITAEKKIFPLANNQEKDLLIVNDSTISQRFFDNKRTKAGTHGQSRWFSAIDFEWNSKFGFTLALDRYGRASIEDVSGNAQRVGLKAGDLIVQIGTHSLHGQAFSSKDEIAVVARNVFDPSKQSPLTFIFERECTGSSMNP